MAAKQSYSNFGVSRIYLSKQDQRSNKKKLQQVRDELAAQLEHA
jgi:hypothetical protein